MVDAYIKQCLQETYVNLSFWLLYNLGFQYVLLLFG